MTVTIVIDMPEAAWETTIPGIRAMVSETLHKSFAMAASHELINADIEIGVTLAGDEHLRGLNHHYRGKNQPTNVLSFPLWNGEFVPNAIPLLLGDIVIGFETVRDEAARDRKPLQDHLRHMLVHGLLHLLGHDHEIEAEAEAMEALERKILLEFGVADPYLLNSEVF